jgi:hypothetical protein
LFPVSRPQKRPRSGFDGDDGREAMQQKAHRIIPNKDELKSQFIKATQNSQQRAPCHNLGNGNNDPNIS